MIIRFRRYFNAMKKKALYIVSSIILIFLTSLKRDDELKIDWQRITDKNYILKYVNVKYDSTSQEAINRRSRMYDIENDARVFSKNEVKLIKALISDTTNFSNEESENEEEICKSIYFKNAIVVLRNNELAGIINILCDEKLWVLEPKTEYGETILFNEKGIKLKDIILKDVKKPK